MYGRHKTLDLYMHLEYHNFSIRQVDIQVSFLNYLHKYFFLLRNDFDRQIMILFQIVREMVEYKSVEFKISIK